MLKEWVCEYFTLVALPVIFLGKVLQTVQTLLQLNALKSTVRFLVIDIFSNLHNLLVNKVLFTKPRLNDYQHATGKKGKASM